MALELHEWLLSCAHLSERIVERTCAVLEDEDVFNVDDLRVLRKLARLKAVLKPVTAAKIAAALDVEASQASAEQQITPRRVQSNKTHHEDSTVAVVVAEAEDDASAMAEDALEVAAELDESASEEDAPNGDMDADAAKALLAKEGLKFVYSNVGTGFHMVVYDKRAGKEGRGRPYRARMSLGGKLVHLGTYRTAEQAAYAYAKATSNTEERTLTGRGSGNSKDHMKNMTTASQAAKRKRSDKRRL